MLFSAAELDFLTENLKLVHFYNYAVVALLTALVYDTLLTTPREVRFIWKGDVSLRKIMYIITRYYALASLIVIVKMSLSLNPPIKSCHVYLKWFTSSTLVVEEALINILLILRINALFGGDKKVLFFILLMYLLEVALLIYTGIRAPRETPLSALPAGISGPGCLLYVVTPPSFTFTLIGWIPALIFSAILLAFAVYKVRDDLGPETPAFWNFASWNVHHPLLLAIFQQGVIFYVVNTAIILLNTTFLTRIHNVLNTIPIPLGIVVYSFCGCRFLLNFHELSNKDYLDVGQIDENAGGHAKDNFMLSTL